MTQPAGVVSHCPSVIADKAEQKKGAATMAYPSTRGRVQYLPEDAIAALTERFDQFAEQFGHNARDAGNSVSSAINDGRRQVRNIADEGYQDIRRHTRDGVEHIKSPDRENPLSSVIVALAAGVLIGKLL